MLGLNENFNVRTHCVVSVDNFTWQQLVKDRGLAIFIDADVFFVETFSSKQKEIESRHC